MPIDNILILNKIKTREMSKQMDKIQQATERIQRATTIIDQIGGHRFCVMTGAKDISATDQGVQFKLPARTAKNGANLVSIELTPEDVYTMTFSKFRHLDVTPISKHSGLYADQLAQVFEDQTALRTSL